MNPIFARALAPFAPPQSVVHQIVSDDQAQQIDAAMLRDKKAEGYRLRAEADALALQIKTQDKGV